MGRIPDPADLDDWGCGLAFFIVLVAAAVALAYRMLRWSGMFG